METLIEFVYYYPPAFVINNILSVGLDQYQMVYMEYKWYPISQPAAGFTNIESFANEIYPLTYGGETVYIYMTPEAYTNWYGNNTTAILASSQSQSLSGLYNTLKGSNQEQITAEYVSAQNWQLISYNAYVQSLPSGTVLPLKYIFQEENDKTQLYALIDTSGNFGWSPVGNGPATNAITQQTNNTISIPAWLYLGGAAIAIIVVVILMNRMGTKVSPGSGVFGVIKTAGKAVERTSTSGERKRIEKARKEFEVAHAIKTEKKFSLKAEDIAAKKESTAAVNRATMLREKEYESKSNRAMKREAAAREHGSDIRVKERKLAKTKKLKDGKLV
ncbi:MAG: hypothetical protein ACREBJ_10480 [Nitrosotalea sp.]